MPAKGGRRGRKHKGTSHVVPAIPPVESLAKPASYKPIDYSKFDNLLDSDEESEHAYTPADLGLGDIPLGGTEAGDEQGGCACVHCRERAEAAEQAAAAAAAAEKQRSNSSKAVAVHSSSKSDFDWGKAFKNQSVKAKIAEGKANRAHGLEDSTLRFPVTIPCENDVTKSSQDAQKQSSSAKSLKKSGHSKAPKSIASNEPSDPDWRPDLNPTFEICCDFVRMHLPARGCSDDVVRKVVKKLILVKESNSTRTPMVALMSIFAEQRLGFDSADLMAYAKKCMNDGKRQQSNRKQQQKPKDAPDPLGFQAMMEKQGLANANTTFSFTSLSGDHLQHTQPGLQNAHSEATANVASSEASGESTPYESSSEDSDDIPPLVDIEQDVCPPRFPADSSGWKGFAAASKPAAKQQAAAKAPAANGQPSAARPAAKPTAKPAALSAAKPPGKAASTASKPSLARSTAKSPAAARVSQPQHVTTVSDDEDDDDDDEEMPDLVSSDDSDEDDDNNSDATDAPPGLLTSDEEDDYEDWKQHEKAIAASFDRIAAELGSPMESTALESSNHRLPLRGKQQPPSDSKAKGKQVPSAAKTEGKAAPPAATTEGKAAPSAASAEPMFLPVSRGFLAQYTSSLAARAAQAGSTSNAEEAINNDLKEASSGTPFLFNRALAGGSKEPAAAPGSKAGTASKADSNVPISQQPAYPFPQHETTEEYKAAMGIGRLNHGEEDVATGNAFQFDPAMEKRKKYAAEKFSRGVAAGPAAAHAAAHAAAGAAAAAADEARRCAAADEVAKQLLEEEEHDKAEAAAKAEKAKKEKQKTKKAKQKAKKKAQQDKAGAKRSQAATLSPAQASKASQADSSESEEEEERERFSLLDSRFASLVDDSDEPLVGSQGAKGAPFLGQGSQLVPPLSTHDIAAGSTTAESGNGEEGRDNTMMQFGGAYSFLSTVGRGSGPASEKSHSSQESSSRLPSLPVLPPGESPLLHVKNAAQKVLPHSQAGSSNQVPVPPHIPLGLRPGAKPGMDPTYQSPASQHPGPSVAQTGSMPSPDSAMSLVLETCSGVVREMEEASGAGDKGRLQEALKEAVNWLSKNGSNPDVATNSAQVRRALHDAKAKLRELGSRPALPQARPPALSSAAPAASHAAHSLSFPSGSTAAGTERTPATSTRQASLDLASEARRHPFRDGQPPPPPPPRAGQPPPPPPPRIPPGPPGVQGPAAVRTSAQPGIRPYLQPYQLPPSGMRSGGVQGPQGSLRQPYPQQASQEPYRQSFPGALEPYRPVAGGREVGPAAGRGPAGRPSYTGPGQGPTAGLQQAPSTQEEVYSAYRPRQAQPRPPAMPAYAPLPPQPGPSQAASYGSDSLDRSMSGSEAMSPVKSMEARYEAKTKYVQPTPFGVREQPSFDEHDETDCVVCMDDVRCTIFVPCGHCLCCQSCAETVVQKYKHCPVCSTPVDGFCATL